LGERDEQFVVVTFVEVFREVREDGDFREDLDHFGRGDQLFFRSGRLRVRVFEMTVRATKSL